MLKQEEKDVSSNHISRIQAHVIKLMMDSALKIIETTLLTIFPSFKPRWVDAFAYMHHLIGSTSEIVITCVVITFPHR